MVLAVAKVRSRNARVLKNDKRFFWRLGMCRLCVAKDFDFFQTITTLFVLVNRIESNASIIDHLQIVFAMTTSFAKSFGQ